MKSVIFIGGTPETRTEAIEQRLNQLSTWKPVQVAENLKSAEKVRKAIASIIGIPGSPLNNKDDYHFVKDNYLANVNGKTPTVLILPELQGLLKESEQEFVELVSDLLTHHYRLSNPDTKKSEKQKETFLTLISVSKLPFELSERVKLYVGKNPSESQTPQMLFKQYFETVTL